MTNLRQTLQALEGAGRKAPLRLGVAALMVLQVAAADDGVLWELDLSDYELGPADTLPRGVEVIEEDGKRILRRTGEATQFFFGRESSVRAAANWNNIRFRVRYREPDKSTFSLVVKRSGLRGEISYLQYYVGVRNDAVTLRCHGLPKELPESLAEDDPRISSEVKYADRGMDDIPPGEWVEAEAAVGNEVIKVSIVTDDGVKREVEFPTFPGMGGISVLSRSALDIASASVRDAGKEIVASP